MTGIRIRWILSHRIDLRCVDSFYRENQRPQGKLVILVYI